jgi:hypothetical protein
MCEIDAPVSGYGIAVGFYESGDEPSSSIKGGEFVDMLNDLSSSDRLLSIDLVN